MPKNQQRILCITGLLLFNSLVVSAATSLAQQSNPSNPVSPTSALQPTGQFVGTITDPITGKQYDRYLVQEMVPVPRWEQQEVTQRLAVPQWVTENIKATETRYIPYVEYQPQQRVLNRWNPMAQPQVTVEYVPVTKYQAINQVVDRPIQYQKYTEQDVKVVVPKLVQATEARAKYDDRERTPTSNAVTNSPNTIQNAATLAMANRNSQLPQYATRPLDGWYGGSQAPLTMYPYATVATPPNMPFSGSMYANNPRMLPGGSSPIIAASPYSNPQSQFVSNQTIVPPVSNAYSSPYLQSAPPANYYAANRSLFQSPIQWPTWSNSNGPLFRQDLFRQNQTAPYTQPINGALYPTVASQSGVSGYLRPSTAPMMPPTQSVPWGNFGGTNNYRDPIQAGLAPTVLR